MQSDIEISQQTALEPIEKIAESIGLTADDIELYGKYKAKIGYKKLQEIAASPFDDGRLILVTAITPTAAGEGKSTVSIGLGDALHLLNKNVIIALREPSLGPCFGTKGGATGGGYSQIAPMEEINLHFTGDIHAVTTANNLLATISDNHIYQGNKLGIDEKTIVWKRCLDLNDRTLREITIAQGAKINGVERRAQFCISVASEVMAILCLAENIADLKARLSKIVVAKDFKGKYVTAADLNAVGAMAAVLKDALKPNLVQTLEHTPALVHGGPFANIAHGCNSLIATKTALKLADYVVTEAGFGADLGAEKFMDIKCRQGHIAPSAVVIVATIRALKMHGGIEKDKLNEENLVALNDGFDNLHVHVENMQKFGVPVVVAINRFVTDTPEEIALLKQKTEEIGVKAVLCEGWEKGGKGVEDLAQEVIKMCDEPNEFHYMYQTEEPIEDKISQIAKEIYRAKYADFSDLALQKIRAYSERGYGELCVCIAKTQNSISHDKALRNAPHDYALPIRDVSLSAGAGFVVAYAGNILDMPGLPEHPAAENIDVDDNGRITGLF